MHADESCNACNRAREITVRGANRVTEYSHRVLYLSLAGPKCGEELILSRSPELRATDIETAIIVTDEEYRN